MPSAGASALHSLAIVASPTLLGQLTAGTLIINGSFESMFTNWSVSDVNSPFQALVVRYQAPPSFGEFLEVWLDSSVAGRRIESLTDGPPNALGLVSCHGECQPRGDWGSSLRSVVV